MAGEVEVGRAVTAVDGPDFFAASLSLFQYPNQSLISLACLTSCITGVSIWKSASMNDLKSSARCCNSWGLGRPNKAAFLESFGMRVWTSNAKESGSGPEGKESNEAALEG